MGAEGHEIHPCMGIIVTFQTNGSAVVFFWIVFQLQLVVFKKTLSFYAASAQLFFEAVL